VDQNSMNKAAERLMGATWDTYKTLINHTLTLQQRNARFVQEMVDDSIEELRRQAESNRAMTRELLELAEGQREIFSWSRHRFSMPTRTSSSRLSPPSPTTGRG
jgi:hypothetical protein